MTHKEMQRATNFILEHGAVTEAESQTQVVNPEL